MKEMDSRLMGLILCLILVVNVRKGADAETHEVGDSTGWTVPPSTTFYAEWASDETFHVGDILNFTWTGSHDVAVATKAQYDGCDQAAPVNLTRSGNYNLTTAGEHYFICTITGHCTQGQKLAINVSDSSTTPSPPPPPSSSSSPPPSPSNSSASTVSVNVLFATTSTLFVYLMAYV